MALSRPLRNSQLVAQTSKRNFCRFCGKEAISRTFLNLQSNEKRYTKSINKLKYMNIRPTKKLNLNICKPCYSSFNVAYNFYQNYNRTQLRLADIEVIEAENAERDRSQGEINRVLENIKTENESADEIDVEEIDESGASDEGNKLADLDKSWTSYTWTCCHCDATYDELDELRSHSKKKHGICFGFECPDCDIKLNKYDAFIEHVRNHKGNLRFYCDICDEPIKKNSSHRHESGRVKCQYCGQLFQNNSQRSLHQNNYETRSVTDAKTISECYIITVPDLQLIDDPQCDVFQSWKDYVWVCGMCQYKFHSVKALRNHSFKVHDTCCTMKCLDCNETPETFHSLITHISRHRPSLRHFCPFCNRIAHSDDLFREHIQDHLTNSSYCIGCGEINPNQITNPCPKDSTSVYWFLEPTGPKEKKKLIEISKKKEQTAEKSKKYINNDDNKDDGDNIENDDNNENQTVRVKEEPREEEEIAEEVNKEGNENGGKTDTENNNATGEVVNFQGDEDAELIDYRLPSPTLCVFCDTTFTDKRLYREHTKTGYCSICDDSFNCVVFETEHLLDVHYAEKPFECYKCGKCFRRLQGAYSCMESHLTEATIMCEICHSMVLASFLKEHVETHKYDCGPLKKACGYGYCKLKFASWIERVNHRQSKHLYRTDRKIRSCRRFLTQRNILGLLPMTDKLPVE